MISDQLNDTLVEQIIKGLIGQGTEGMRPVMEEMEGVGVMEVLALLRAGMRGTVDRDEEKYFF